MYRVSFFLALESGVSSDQKSFLHGIFNNCFCGKFSDHFRNHISDSTFNIHHDISIYPPFGYNFLSSHHWFDFTVWSFLFFGPYVASNSTFENWQLKNSYFFGFVIQSFSFWFHTYLIFHVLFQSGFFLFFLQAKSHILSETYFYFQQ